jgi:hypothetical protein
MKLRRSGVCAALLVLTVSLGVGQERAGAWGPFSSRPAHRSHPAGPTRHLAPPRPFVHQGNALPGEFDALFADLREVNRMFASGRWGYRHNCVSCSVAADDRLGGGSAVAETRPHPLMAHIYRGRFAEEVNGWSTRVLARLLGPSPWRRFRTVRDLETLARRFQALPDGASGLVLVEDHVPGGTWGHMYNVHRRGGQVYFIDAQTAGFARLRLHDRVAYVRTR